MAVTGPVDLLALTFPAHRIDPAVVDIVAGAVRHQDARILDLLVVVADAEGATSVVDVSDELARYGLTPLLPEEGALMSDEDVETVAAGLPPGHAAVLVVYEHLWAVRVTDAVLRAGGEVALHVHVPMEAMAAAVSADSGAEPALAGRPGEREGS
jgi:Family of unknown function (DUF6325)